MTDHDKLAGAVLIAVVCVLTATVAVAVTYDAQFTSGAHFQTDQGLTVELGYDAKIQSGNPFTSPRSVVLRRINFTADGAGEATLAYNGTSWTNVTSIDATQGAAVKFDPHDDPRVGASGQIDEVRLNESLDETTTGETGMVVSAYGSGRVFLFTGGNGAVAVNSDTGTTIDDGTVYPNGTVAFDIPSGGTYPIDFQPAPTKLFVFNESDPDQLIDSNAQLRIRFFIDGREEVIEKTVTDGTADLSDLPADERFVVTVQEDEADFEYRRIIIEDLTEQQEVYLLPASQPSVDVEFQLTDYTGLYPPSETTLYIESPITKDFDGDSKAETRYVTIAGDNFGASGEFPSVLQQSERYRLRIDSGSAQRVLGSYTASRDEIEEIRVQGLELEPPDSQPFVATRNVTRRGNGLRGLNFAYVDESDDTTELNLAVKNRSSGNVIFSDTVTNAPIKEYKVYNITLQNDTSYVVEWNATRNGSAVGARMPIGGDGFGVQIPLDAEWLGTGGLVIVVFISSLAGARKHTYIAIATVGFAGLLMWLQAVRILVPLWFLALVIAAGGHLRQMQTPNSG